jgi:hypothetical protein
MRALGVEDAAGAADDLISLLEGLLVDHVLGRRRSQEPTARHVALRRDLLHFLRGVSGPTTTDDSPDR